MFSIQVFDKNIRKNALYCLLMAFRSCKSFIAFGKLLKTLFSLSFLLSHQPSSCESIKLSKMIQMKVNYCIEKIPFLTNTSSQ